MCYFYIEIIASLDLWSNLQVSIFDMLNLLKELLPLFYRSQHNMTKLNYSINNKHFEEFIENFTYILS